MAEVEEEGVVEEVMVKKTQTDMEVNKVWCNYFLEFSVSWVGRPNPEDLINKMM